MTPAKIRIPDDTELRAQLEQEYRNASQAVLCRYALLLAAHTLKLIDDSGLVGVRVSNAIRNYKNHERSAEKEMASVQGAHSSPRPHVRAAHWHTFWVGPRSAKFPDRKPIIRWLPPIPIGMDWKTELLTNIHTVLES